MILNKHRLIYQINKHRCILMNRVQCISIPLKQYFINPLTNPFISAFQSTEITAQLSGLYSRIDIVVTVRISLENKEIFVIWRYDCHIACVFSCILAIYLYWLVVELLWSSSPLSVCYFKTLTNVPQLL